MPASITDPGVGASTWASGNQICIGITGTLTENEKNIKRNKINCRLVFKLALEFNIWKEELDPKVE